MEFFDDVRRPQGLVEVLLGEPQKRVAQVRWVQHTRVQNDRERHQWTSASASGRSGLFVHPALAGNLDHSIQRLTPL